MTCLVDSDHHSGRNPCHPAGESRKPYLRVEFDRRLKLEFHRSKITSDAGVLAHREMADVLGLTDLRGAALSDLRRGKNTRHLLMGLDPEAPKPPDSKATPRACRRAPSEPDTYHCNCRSIVQSAPQHQEAAMQFLDQGPSRLRQPKLLPSSASKRWYPGNLG